jgi:hypothetical protein
MMVVDSSVLIDLVGDLVRAHALMPCTGLITGGAGFSDDHFKGLKIVVPEAG